MGKREARTKLRRKVRELARVVDANFTEKNLLIVKTRQIINEYMKNGGERPVLEISKELELMQRLLVKTQENIEREQIYRRTREEWTKIEQRYIPPDPKEVPEGYQICACWNCNNIFERVGKKKYCSSKCAQEQMDANKRLKATGTFLAPKRDDYMPNREENAGNKDNKRLVYTDNIDKYYLKSERQKTGNRPYSPKRSPDKPNRVRVKFGDKESIDKEKQRRYEGFIRGELPGVFTVNIKTGIKIYHTNGKKHEVSEEDSSIGA
ncbi:hypothetical protein [Heyndrickxia ginsengihumi]|uniref:hypothetical protein n=1 Tax=Heyndrickxia ginsengihumi TaxID=363870 RepID=UPI003D25AEF6